MAKVTNVYYDEKRKTYYAIASLGYDRNGKRITKTKRGFTTQKAAKKWHDETKVNYYGNISHQEVTKIKFGEFLTNYYIPEYEKSVSIRTFDAAKPKFKHLDYFSSMYLSEIKPLDVKKWHGLLFKKNYANNYIRNLHQMFKQVLDKAMSIELIDRNVAVIVGNVKRVKTEMKFWTLDEVSKLLSTFDRSDLYNYFKFVTIYFMFMTGVRISELQALEWKDIDFKKKTVLINKSMYLRKNNEFYINPTKTAKGERIIHLDHFTIELMREWKEKQKMIYDLRFVFSVEDMPITKSTLCKTIKTHAELAGIKRIRTHDLRHSHASLLLEIGANNLELQSRLGHADISTTLGTYSHLKPNGLKETANRIEDRVVFNIEDYTLNRGQFHGNQHLKI